MNQRTASLLLLSLLAVISPSTGRGAVAQPDQQKKEAPAKKKSEQGSTLTGCVDQQEGNYVLIDARSRAVIADLIAEGFPTEGFAKHVGQMVTVKGSSTSGGARPAMKVRTVSTVSETCAPQ